MKKIISILLIAVLLLSITGCSGTKTQTENKDKKVKVGFIYVGPIGDGGYTYAHDQGRLYLEKELGVETIYKESVKEDKAEVEKVVEDMIDQGATIIFGTSFGFQEGLLSSAKKHPEIKFLHCSGYETAENMGQYFGKIEQMRYLTGIVAGLKTKTNKIGYVAAFPIPEVIRGINAFTLGVKSVNKDATVKVVWV